MRILDLLANLFPLWVLLGGALALWDPALFAWFTPYVVPGLGVIMLGMGLTLSFDDFAGAARCPGVLALGLAAQFTIMPALGWSIARLLDVPDEFATGLILVACCPGGTASNVVTYIARGHVALSVLMTACSTFGAIVMTPLLTKWLVGQRMPVDAWGLFVSTVQVVLLPVGCGLLLHHALPRLVQRVTPIAPLVSVITIALICANILGANAEAVRTHLVELGVAVALLHAGGFALGYLAARLFGYEEVVGRTVSIEVGMQNSGLGAALATKHFAHPTTGVALAAVPCAISAVMHSVIGSILAAVWRSRPPRSVTQQASGRQPPASPLPERILPRQPEA